MKDGQQIRFSGEGDQTPGLDPGDVVIVLDEKEHDVFRRRGIDLLMLLEISLTEALCGFQRCIQTLDDRSLIIMSLPGTDWLWLLQLCTWEMLASCSTWWQNGGTFSGNGRSVSGYVVVDILKTIPISALVSWSI